jgi:hypothetical protein
VRLVALGSARYGIRACKELKDLIRGSTRVETADFANALKKRIDR